MPDATRPSRLRHMLVLAFTALAICAGGCSQDVGQFMQQAKQARDKGDRNAAIIYLKNALEKDPKNAEARYFLGTLYNESRDAPAAESELRRAAELGLVEGGRVMAELGRALLLQSRYPPILRDVKPADSFENEPLASVVAFRGRAQFATGLLAEARTSYAAAAKASGKNADVMVLGVLIKVAERDTAAAESQLDQAIAAHPKNLEIWMLKADLLRSQKKLDETLQVYQKILDIDPKDIPTRTARGALYLELGKKAEAQKEVDDARAVRKNNVGTMYLQALIISSRANIARR